MDIYQYIAYSDPYLAKDVCNRFGFETNQARTEDDMADALKQLVSEHGREALAAIVDVHPDKEVILELTGSKNSLSKDCGCKDKKPVKTAESYVHAAQNGFTLQQGNTFLIAAALILAVAIISSSNKSK